MRADQWLVAKNVVKTRSQAKDLIKRGKVKANGCLISKAGHQLEANAQIELLEQEQYVGRGARKLKAALEAFQLNLHERVAVDLGASTGGFTQILLEQGCSKVFAIDVGHDQLAASLRDDSRVVNMEGINARHAIDLPDPVSLVVADLSFISLRLVWSTITALLNGHGDGILLVKPQFEAGPGGVNQRGIVADKSQGDLILKDLISWGEVQGLKTQQWITSPITGKKGNREYLIHVKPC